MEEIACSFYPFQRGIILIFHLKSDITVEVPSALINFPVKKGEPFCLMVKERKVCLTPIQATDPLIVLTSEILSDLLT